jgi:hypothetical protein
LGSTDLDLPTETSIGWGSGARICIDAELEPVGVSLCVALADCEEEAWFDWLLVIEGEPVAIETDEDLLSLNDTERKLLIVLELVVVVLFDWVILEVCEADSEIDCEEEAWFDCVDEIEGLTVSDEVLVRLNDPLDDVVIDMLIIIDELAEVVTLLLSDAELEGVVETEGTSEAVEVLVKELVAVAVIVLVSELLVLLDWLVVPDWVGDWLVLLDWVRVALCDAPTDREALPVPGGVGVALEVEVSDPVDVRVWDGVLELDIEEDSDFELLLVAEDEIAGVFVGVVVTVVDRVPELEGVIEGVGVPVPVWVTVNELP